MILHVITLVMIYKTKLFGEHVLTSFLSKSSFSKHVSSSFSFRWSNNSTSSDCKVLKKIESQISYNSLFMRVSFTDVTIINGFNIHTSFSCSHSTSESFETWSLRTSLSSESLLFLAFSCLISPRKCCKSNMIKLWAEFVEKQCKICLWKEQFSLAYEVLQTENSLAYKKLFMRFKKDRTPTTKLVRNEMPTTT